MIETNSNQEVRVARFKAPCDKEHPYVQYSVDALDKAMCDLEDCAFKMWCYLLTKNPDGFILSKADAVKNWGVGSYDRAIKELIERGYLVEISKNYYKFYQIPEEKP